MNRKRYNVAIVGATGMVGQKMAEILVERNFPFSSLKLLASFRSVDTKMEIGGRLYTVEEAVPEAFGGVDFAFFSAGGEISLALAPEAAKRGAVVIDNSSAFRMDEAVPLVVPEINPEAALTHRGIIANPNCSTTQMVVALYPLHRAAGLKRVVASTYQAVSGAGREALEELHEQNHAVLENRPVTAAYLPCKGAPMHHQIAYNVIPQIDVFTEDGYSKEEMKMVHESRKIMGLPDLPITVTTVRVPVVYGHSEALNVEFEREITPAGARTILSRSAGIVVQDEPEKMVYPMPVYGSDTDEVYVGRIRTDDSVPHGLNLWVVSDNIRKGAATNSIQIAELLLSRR